MRTHLLPDKTRGLRRVLRCLLAALWSSAAERESYPHPVLYRLVQVVVASGNSGVDACYVAPGGLAGAGGARQGQSAEKAGVCAPF